MIAAGLSFTHPAPWPLLVLVLGVGVALHLRARRRERAARERYGERRGELAACVPDGRRRRRSAWHAAGLACLVLAWMEPRWGSGEHELVPRGVDLLFVLDLSRSMAAQDVTPSRLERAKHEIRELVGRHPADRHALLVFAGEARLACPFTRDAVTFGAVLDAVSPDDLRRGGTDLGRALAVARSLFADRSPEHAVCCLLTDGEDHAGQALEAAGALVRAGVELHVLGLGSIEGAKIPVTDESGVRYLRDAQGLEVVTTMDRASLERLAHAADGEFVDVLATRRPLLGLYERRVEPRARAAFEQRLEAHRELRYAWPLSLAFALFLAGLARSDRRSR